MILVPFVSSFCFLLGAAPPVGRLASVSSVNSCLKNQALRSGSCRMTFLGNYRGGGQLIFERNYGLIAVRFKEAGVAKLADAPDLGSGGAILRGSSPLSGKYFIISELKHKLH
jgi:hypothetical protein